MNILLLTTHLNPGGITSYIISLAKALKKMGHNVYVGSSGGKMRDHLSSYGIRHIDIPIRTKCEVSPKVFFSFLRLQKQLAGLDIDIIHAHTRVTQVLGFILKKSSRCMYISTCHGFFKRRFSRMIFPAWGDHVIAISEAVAEHLRRDFKVKNEMITVIHNGIDLDRFRPLKSEDRDAMREELNLSKQAPIVAMVARLSEVKGHTFFIQAMPLILKQFPLAQFLIVGEGRIKDQLINQVNKLGISSAVFFIPDKLKPAKILSAIDCVVCPSLQEGLGLSIMEAQAVGVAVVAFDTGGIGSLIKDKESGILVSRGDVRGLAQGVIRILGDDKLGESVTQKARENLEAKFSIERMAEETQELYSKLIHK